MVLLVQVGRLAVGTTVLGLPLELPADSINGTHTSSLNAGRARFDIAWLMFQQVLIWIYRPHLSNMRRINPSQFVMGIVVVGGKVFITDSKELL